MLMALLGAALFFGDGVITPSISVLSAVEGLEVVAPHLEHWVVPLAVLVLLGLFWLQRHGTAKVGALFGPICVLWFLSLAVHRRMEHHPGTGSAVGAGSDLRDATSSSCTAWRPSSPWARWCCA